MDPKVQKSIDQMKSFIIQEANEKAEEITANAEEDYYTEKNSLLEAEKERIRKEYARKQSQISVKRRIEISNRTNTILLDIQKQRNEMLESLLEKAKLNSAEQSKNTDKYKQLLVNLISQGLTELLETHVSILCRKEDVAFVKESIPEAIKKAEESIAPKKMEFHVIIDENESLPSGPDHSKSGQFCAGGVILTCHDGRIRLNNTLEARLKIAYENLLPKMKGILFPDKLQTIF
ncbi:putative V-type proton ATPase subunit E [Monocercomonoides exilis]|uniref:putative V-type proton ATPase subunit E n=1 Tax=Monocercomonoides exilis TaxID=2049356 RepID=UPI0035598F18|nr:putative V-type proton ATPase subunit E [Monocercomonoides exilis]|eukprot:MONOS_13442.1-p1 / transcript=MONOS_13442.1 / gene=MONOS_13442 / organism=Monocercomonoides_exilis_PA203 / gene_product=V-type proton ATPase subunit E / transcript_product=V-type proton ATPase subunit E / location=Mono_scaffold00829:24038-24931(+) / protein_length=234 / sequence_SO=supercontig / SO=protein_coding / is_pseudo=false